MAHTISFQLIRLVLYQAMQTYRLLLLDIKNNRDLLVLHNKPFDKLSTDQRLRQLQLFAKHPAIAAIYSFRQSLYR